VTGTPGIPLEEATTAEAAATAAPEATDPGDVVTVTDEPDATAETTPPEPSVDAEATIEPVSALTRVSPVTGTPGIPLEETETAEAAATAALTPEPTAPVVTDEAGVPEVTPLVAPTAVPVLEQATTAPGEPNDLTTLILLAGITFVGAVGGLALLRERAKKN
jgi:hypothetical protein